MKKLGFIGLGNQGAAIAGRMLAAGNELQEKGSRSVVEFWRAGGAD